MTPRTILTNSVIASALICLAPSLDAADRFWIDSAGGPFGDTLNWSTTAGGAGGASVPVAADIANFTLNNTYTVTFAGPVTNTALDVHGGTVTFDLNGNTYTLTTAFGVDIAESQGETGRLTITDGTLAVDTNGDILALGVSSFTSGFLTVSTGGRIGDGTIRPNLTVGFDGTGTLTVTDTGRIDGQQLTIGSQAAGPQAGSNGSATVTGPNAVVDLTSSITVGSFGAGTLSILNGGTVATGSFMNLGSVTGSDGTVAVSGAGSSLTLGSTLTVGSAGDGIFTVSSGAHVSGASATLGSSSTGFGTATVTGTNSRWNLSGATIGSFGLGVMTVSSGGQVVSNNAGTLGAGAGSEGRVTVSGTGAQWTLGISLTVGSSGTGDLTISASGEVSATTVSLGGAATGSGVATITGAGSKLTTTGDVTVATGGAGTLNVASGGELSVGANLTVNDPAAAPFGTLNLDGGSIFVAGNFTNNSVFNFTDGVLQVKGNIQPNPGGGPVPLTINGADSNDLPTLELIGTGLTNNVSVITVGNNHRGQLLLRQGRSVAVGANSVNIGALVGGEGIISVQSGAFLGVALGGSLAVGGAGASAGGRGTLEISGGTVSVVTLRLFTDGTINLNSGTLRVDSLPLLDGKFNWTSGTLLFGADTVLSSANAPKLLGLDGTLRSGQELSSVPGVGLTLNTPIVVDGGLLSPSSLVNNSRLDVRSGSANVASLLTNNAGGLLFLERDLSVGSFLANASGARLELAGGTGRLLGAGSVQNAGIVTGEGTISNPFTNASGGEVRGELGKTLYFTGATGPNAGRLNLLGGTLSFAQQFTNSATGQINGQGALYFPTTPVPSNASPNAGLMNAGNINLTGGDSQIYGTVQMQAGSRLIVSGGATASFFDVFRHSGIEVRASAGSNIVFFGEVRGAGSFTGTGTIYFEGGFSPGNSPASVLLGGDIVLGDANTLTLELGGLTAGSEYDQLLLGTFGSLGLDGELVLDLIGGFVPAIGDTFQLLDFDPGQVSGAFDEITVADALPGDLSFDTSALSTTGKITVIPEPRSAILAFLGGTLLGLYPRRRPKTARRKFSELTADSRNAEP